jgi:hypothetical protein
MNGTFRGLVVSIAPQGLWVYHDVIPLDLICLVQIR